MIGPLVTWLLAMLTALSAINVVEPPPPAPVAVTAPESIAVPDLAPCWVEIDEDLSHVDEYGFPQGTPPGYHHIKTQDGELVTIGYAMFEDSLLDPWGVPLELTWCRK